MAYKFEKSGKRVFVSEDEPEASGDDGSYVIVLDYGNSSDGRTYWCYIAVPSDKYREFTRLAAQRATVRLSNYGTILHDGYDREVPSRVKQEMEAKYGCDEEYMQWLRQDIEKMREEFLIKEHNPGNKPISFVAKLKKKYE